jgi:lipopolysaccharide export system protein LptC
MTQGGTELRADSMEYSHLDRVIKFGGRMRAVFSPRESK